MTITFLLQAIKGSEHYIEHHGWFDGFILLWIFTALVNTMPPLPTNAGYFQRWAYAALHLIAANIQEMKAATKIPPPGPGAPAN